MVTCSGCEAVCSENMRFCAACGRAISILDTPTLEPDRNAVAPKPVPASSRPPKSGGFSPGTVLVERYRVVALLGRGGMGEVYRAEDLKLGNVVALKFLPPSLQNDAAAPAGFHAEVRNAPQVSHPNVCRVYDIGEVNGQHFLTMEYIDGEDLAIVVAPHRPLACGQSSGNRAKSALVWRLPMIADCYTANRSPPTSCSMDEGGCASRTSG